MCYKSMGDLIRNPYVQYMYSYPHKTAYRSLSGVSFKEYASCLAGSGHGLYLHIPFCEAKCGYCNLFSVTGQGEEAVDRYLDTAERQCAQYQVVLHPYHSEFSSLTIGGGTPLYLTENQIERMFGMLFHFFTFSNGADMVIETAPNQTDSRKIAVLKQAGVTRVSMGIQSFQNSELAALGRRHTAKKAREALGQLKEAGFSCMNVDFIYGIPGQTVESLLDSLKEGLSYQPDEIFLYPLYVKHGVGLERLGIAADAQAAFLQYKEASQFLRNEGFHQDSMRRFVRREEERRFDECGFGDSLALGCGGRSYLGNLHFCSPYAVERAQCMAHLEEYERTEDFTEITHGILLSKEEMKRRFVIRHLSLYPGLPLQQYEYQFQSSAFEDFPVIKNWYHQGWVETQTISEQEYLSLTDDGLGLSDYLGPMLISEPVKKAMDEWEE